MRLLKLGIYSDVYLDQFYAQREHLLSATYAEQFSSLIDECYGSSDFWTNAFNDLGYETQDVVGNAKPLQQRWALEQKFVYSENDWLFEITAAQIKAFSPDVLLVADYSTYTASFLRQLRNDVSSIRAIIGWCGAPYRDPSVFSEWDIVLSCIPELVDHFRENGHQAWHVDHGFEPRILKKLNVSNKPDVNFSFLGSVIKQQDFHIEREKILLKLIEQTDLEIWSQVDVAGASRGNQQTGNRLARTLFKTAQALSVPDNVLTATPFVRRAAPSDGPFVDERIASRAHPPLFGLAMFQKLRDSRVTLNTHIDISTGSASNMRLFEATGAGACLLTDWKPNISQLFEPDVEVLTYRNADECLEKVQYILAHEHERRAIAAAGQRRTLRDHTVASRAARIDEIICGRHQRL
jgi:spore maturation protein CgeB